MAKCKMERPCWTIAFGIVCALVVPGLVLTHLAVAKLIPHISDLPTNVNKGFDEVFKFAYLEQDSNQVKVSSAAAVKQCNVTDAATTCPNYQPQTDLTKIANDPTLNKDINAANAKAAVIKAFETSLSIVRKIANDKYFGTDDLKQTAKNLDNITIQLNKINTTMKCFQAVPTFCAMFVSADKIVAGIAQVQKATNEFKNSDIVKRWDENKALLTFLHALPYFMVLSLFFFGIFWWRGGVCCFCRDGTKCGTVALIPSILFWLPSFVIYLVVLAAGTSVKYFADKIDVPVLNGKPTLKDAIDHIQTYYPQFWKVVFADLADGLDMLLLASYIFVTVSLLQMIYTGCECCCCPYRKKKDAEDKTGDNV